jgi:primosomal protein N' (replication factor Y)
MYRYELDNRKQFNYPPFSRMLRLTLKHKDHQLLQNAAEKLAQLLSSKLQGNILGPAYAVIPRIRNQYHMEIMLKLPRESASNVKKWMKQQITLWQAVQVHRSVHVQIDVDPQ